MNNVMMLLRCAVMAVAVTAFFGTAFPASALADGAWCHHHPRDARCHPHHPPHHVAPPHHTLPWCDRYHHHHCRPR